MMNKRGISPLIVSVILVGSVIIFALVVNVWVNGVYETVKSQRFSNTKFIDFDLQYLSADKCVNSENICMAEGSIDYYCILIKNKENFDVNYIIKTVGLSGIAISEDCDTLLRAFDSKIFRINYNKGKIGELDYSEVLPYTYA